MWSCLRRIPRVPGLYETLVQLTTPAHVGSRLGQMLEGFATGLGWRYSDHFLDQVGGSQRVHLVVEHGLVDRAVFTFLRADAPFGALGLGGVHTT